MRWIGLGAAVAAMGSPARSEPLHLGSFRSIEDTTFCVTEPALDALVRLRDARDFDTLPAGCFVGTASFFAERAVPFREARLRFMRADPDGPQTCIRPATRERRRCTVTTERVVFVAGQQTDNDGRTIPRRIFVAVPAATPIVGTARRPMR